MAARGSAELARDALLANRRAALGAGARMGRDRLQKLLSRAARELELRLARQAGRGLTDRNFTMAQARATLAHVREVTRGLQRGLGELVVDNAVEAADTSAGHLVEYMRRADGAFRGVGAQPLQLREAAILDAAVSGAHATVLRRLASSGTMAAGAEEEPHPAREGILERYGLATIGHFERAVQVGLVTRQPWGEMRNALTEQSPFLQQAPAYWAERILRTECLTGDTLVSGAVIRAVSRRWYEGDVIEIATERGRKFTTTPNHPMLTGRAWVHAKFVRVGDHLVCYRGQQNAGAARDEHIAAGEATIAEVFDAVSAVGIRERRRGAQPDFHGDGTDRDVDVLTPDGPLALGRFSPIRKPLAEQIFAPSDFARSAFCAVCGNLLSIQKQPCGCRVSHSKARGAHAIDHETIADFQFSRDALRTLPRVIELQDACGVDVISEPRLSPASFEKCLPRARQVAGDAGRAQHALHAIGPDTKLVGNALGAQPRDVEFDRIVSIRIHQFRGHVFNLSTPYGYYAINGAYTGNTAAAYNRSGWEGAREAHDQLGDVCKILSATFDDRTGWDSYQVHGQIRRIDEPFVSAFGRYMHPPNRPNDREVVVPHRLSWSIPKYLVWKTDADVLERWRYEGRKGPPPPRPQPMTTIPLQRFGRAG